MAFGASAPLPWLGLSDADPAAGYLDGDVCFYDDTDGQHAFIRGQIELPVIDVPGEVFAWGVGVSLSQESVDLLADHCDDPARVDLEPRFGWLMTSLPYEDETLCMTTLVHQRPPGPNAGTRRFGELPTEMPSATCIELVCRR